MASKTNKGRWARQLLDTLTIPLAVGEVALSSLIPHCEVYTGSKLRHFAALHKSTGVAYEDMLFFDDARGGKYGNCVPVSELGVVCVHTPDGLTRERWCAGVSAFAAARGADDTGGKIVEAGGGVTDAGGGLPSAGRAAGEVQQATVVRWFGDKGFGFVRLTDRSGRQSGRDVFFHQRALRKGGWGGEWPATGQSARVVLGTDARGRAECSEVSLAAAAKASPDGAEGSEGDGEGEAASGDGVQRELPIFSMNLPFAALLARGVKTLETRNHTMFEGTQGQRVLLHVGRRTYPDGGKHRAILRRSGLTDADIDDAVALPRGFDRGAAVAVLELGATRLAADEAERCDVAIETAVCAYGGEMGRYLTEVVSAEWLREPVPMRGRPGMWRTKVPERVIPEGW